MGGLSIWHWVIVLVVIILVFGTSKLKNLGKDLGGAIKGFKEGMKDASASDPGSAGGSADAKKVEDAKPISSAAGATIDVQAKEKS